MDLRTGENHTAITSADDEVLTPDDVERDWKLRKGTQRALRSRGQLPFYRLGGGRIIRYSRRELEAYMRARAAGGGR